jgi:hypothetical protein
MSVVFQVKLVPEALAFPDDEFSVDSTVHDYAGHFTAA